MSDYITRWQDTYEQVLSDNKCGYDPHEMPRCQTCTNEANRRMDAAIQQAEYDQVTEQFATITSSQDISPPDWSDTELRAIMGGKGLSLRLMSDAGLNVPGWINIPTGYCQNRIEDTDMLAKILPALGIITEGRFGDTEDPVLVSVRSGAPRSMPGMMDTMLNVGINDQTVQGLANTINPDFAWDSYRRLLQQWATIVLGMDAAPFEQAVRQARIVADVEEGLLPADYSHALVTYFQSPSMMGKKFPQDVHEQLLTCINTVFRSWNGDRAIEYRRIEGIDESMGTAVNVQRMVFGNRDSDSLTGVYFSRNPNTGEPFPYGEFLPEAQGEDVVSGEFETRNLSFMPQWVQDELDSIAVRLEDLWSGPVDVEFTVESGTLYILQARAIKATSYAKLRFVLDDFKADRLTADEATAAIAELGEINFASDDTGRMNTITTGVACSPGVVVGRVVRDQIEAQRVQAVGNKAIFVANSTSPEDIVPMDAADAILTMTGGPTCHAAVTARGWGKPCVVGAGGILNYQGFKIGDRLFEWGDQVAINGATGEVMAHG